jgi:hypothetical protein
MRSETKRANPPGAPGKMKSTAGGEQSEAERAVGLKGTDQARRAAVASVARLLLSR